jgi:DNA polymerase
VVFGVGAPGARVLMVGEQPGDIEDERGVPFVGPAGKLLDRALHAAGVERDAAYVTNAVKHFRWKATAGSARRIHAEPDAAHVSACRPWLSAEIIAVQPELVVALGATAAQSLLGPKFRVTQDRGVLLDWPPADGWFAGWTGAPSVRHALATIHPSAVLRGDPAERAAMFDALVADLHVVALALDPGAS